MRKIFTLFAVFFATSLFAADDFVVALSDMTKDGNSYVTADLNKKAIKKVNVYVELPAANVEGTFTVVASDNQDARFLYIYKNGGAEKDASRPMVMTKNGATIEFTASDVMVRDDSKPYLHFYTEDDFKVKTFGYTYEEITTDPVLNVSPESVALHASLKNPAPSAEIVFKGKNLTPGSYNITVPNLAGFKAEPAAVTVGDDGKLNDTITLSFAPEANVDSAETAISLTTAELTKEVKVAYSASFEKDYKYATSVNIEQWVLDNGKQNEAFKAVLEAANIEFENINELDSLNDEKTARNEPYLGLKLKKTGAFVALWLKEGSTVRVKFGFVGDNVNGSISGETEEFTPEKLADPLVFTAPVDCYMKLTTTSDKTVVIKQVMVDEEIAEVVLPKSPQGLDDINTGTKAVKTIENGQIVIIKNGIRYNALGAELR